MAVPYIFATVPGGSSIPLSELDANFSYITSGNPVFQNLTISGNIAVTGTATVSGLTTLNGGLTLAGPLTINGNTVVPTGITGTGLLVFNTGPTLVAPILGTPASGTLTNCTGLPLLTGITGFGANVATWLATPSSANLRTAMLDPTGTGNLVFSNAPLINNASLTSPTLGIPVSGSLGSCTGYLTSNLVGTVTISQGGTGQTTAAAAANALLPSQTGSSNYCLTTNGLGVLSWAPNPQGTVTSITLNPATTGLTVNGSTSAATITTSGTFTLGGILAIANGGTGISSLGSGVQTAMGIAVNTPGGFVTSVTGGTPTGAVLFFAMQTAPSGWLVCNGASVLVATYPDLFAAIGYTYGGSGGSFSLPDLRGQFMRGWDNGAGVDPARTFGSNQADTYLNHSHTINDPEHFHAPLNSSTNGNFLGIVNDGPGQAFRTNCGVGSGPLYSCVETDPAATGITVNTSTTGGTETRPKNVALLPCIKT